MLSNDYEKYLNMVSENRLDEATDFRREIMPKYIYKFYPVYSKTGRGKIDERTFNTLKEDKIWCGKIEHFNDPYEGIGYYLKDLDREMEMRLADCLRIASFTENAASNISMWAYYANNHKGFCVKYEVVNNKYLYDVNYIENRQSQKELFLKAVRKNNKGQSTDKEKLLIYEKYLTKHISWSNEREYRIIFATESDEEKGRTVTCEKLGLKPIKIYAGINCSNEVKRMLNSISLQLGCGELSECSISDNEFKLINE